MDTEQEFYSALSDTLIFEDIPEFENYLLGIINAHEKNIFQQKLVDCIIKKINNKNINIKSLDLDTRVIINNELKILGTSTTHNERTYEIKLYVKCADLRNSLNFCIDCYTPPYSNKIHEFGIKSVKVVSIEHIEIDLKLHTITKVKTYLDIYNT